MTRLVIDPVPRSNGPLRLETELSGGAVSDAWLSATMFRGLERTLRGRDARDAWLLAERVCAIAGPAHALASVRAVENAIGIGIPRNARLLRNLITTSMLAQHEATHFYLRQALDWVDPAAAVRADPTATSTLARSLSDWPASSPADFETARARIGVLLDRGPFSGAYVGHPAYRLPPELSLLVLAHYLTALDWQRTPVRLRTILGGKSPHPQTFLVGGMALTPEWGGPPADESGEHPWGAARHSPRPLSNTAIAELQGLIGDIASFVRDIALPDVLAIATYHPEWEALGLGAHHFLSLGELPLDDRQPPAQLLRPGRVMDRSIAAAYTVDQSLIAEAASSAWLTYTLGDAELLKPASGETEVRYTGPRPPYDSLEGSPEYSWAKAPRYDNEVMECGPLARLLVGYANDTSDAHAILDPIIKRLNGGVGGLFGVLGRTIARAAEAQLTAERMAGWLTELVANLASGDLAVINPDGASQSMWPTRAEGVGLAEAPDGSVGHWLAIEDGRISTYQIVAGSTWNGSPRDGRGRRGPCEQALLDVPVADPQRPLELLRVVHSFDICAACATQ